MKLSFLLSALVFITSLITTTQAQIVLNPGEGMILTNVSANGGVTGDNGNFTFNMNGNYDLGLKIIKSQTISNGVLSIGKGEAYALLYYDFQISETPETHNNTVGGWINYRVFWQGFQEIFSTLLSNAIVKIEFVLRDQTSGELLNNEVIHNFDIKTATFLDILVIGLNFNDTAEKFNTFPVVFTRGHQYRIHLKLTTTLLISTPSAIPAFCDYMDGLTGGGDGRVELTHLLVKIGLDEKETLQKLAKLDSLESRIDTLEYKLEHHYHTYLTGRGVGHNNTEANTTLSIFEAGSSVNTDPPQYYSEPNIVPDETIEESSAPKEFSLSQNFPNPFNPNTKISYSIPAQEHVTIKIFDILGRQVEILTNEIKGPGYYEVDFNADNLSSGTYIYELRAGSYIETKKMTLIR